MIRTLEQSMKARPLLNRWSARLGLEAEVATLASTIKSTQPGNLRGYYKCDEVSGALQDSSGNANHLAVQGSGATYGISGLVGDAVNGNGTQGWNNDGAVDSGVSFLPGDNGYTVMTLVRSQTPVQDKRFLGFGSSVGNIQAYLAQWTQSGNRTPRTYHNSVGTGTVNVLMSNLLPDTDWHLLGLRTTLGGGSPDLMESILDGTVATLSSDITWAASPGTVLDTICVNSMVHTGIDRGFYGGWDLQHACVWDSELTDAEILTIAQVAGVA
jgi:hypothetical protein